MAKKRRRKGVGKPPDALASPKTQPAPAPAPTTPTQPWWNPDRWYLHVIIFVALVTATCELYQGDLNLGFFVLDDSTYVAENPWIKGVNFKTLGHVLAQPYFANSTRWQIVICTSPQWPW